MFCRGVEKSKRCFYVASRSQSQVASKHGSKKRSAKTSRRVAERASLTVFIMRERESLLRVFDLRVQQPAISSKI
jgi:hypothetical protein